MVLMILTLTDRGWLFQEKKGNRKIKNILEYKPLFKGVKTADKEYPPLNLTNEIKEISQIPIILPNTVLIPKGFWICVYRTSKLPWLLLALASQREWSGEGHRARGESVKGIKLEVRLVKLQHTPQHPIAVSIGVCPLHPDLIKWNFTLYLSSSGNKYLHFIIH